MVVVTGCAELEKSQATIPYDYSLVHESLRRTRQQQIRIVGRHALNQSVRSRQGPVRVLMPAQDELVRCEAPVEAEITPGKNLQRRQAVRAEGPVGELDETLEARAVEKLGPVVAGTAGLRRLGPWSP